MGEKNMYTRMCNWVPMLYSGKKIVLGEITTKKKILKIPNCIYFSIQTSPSLESFPLLLY